MIRQFSPQKKICEVALEDIQQALIKIFVKWGLPKWIKVDNGRPFGDPQLELIPPLALWLISLGIQVIWNRPRTPQDNAKVERSQGIMANWTELSKCQNTEHLRSRLHREAYFHNYHFPIRRWKNKKKIERFPELAFTGKSYEPENFDMQRALDFLAQASWQRTVSKNGQVNLYGKRYNLGTMRKHQIISIKLDPNLNQWVFFDTQGEPIKQYNTNFSKQSITNLDFSN
ncbi:MAG: hypothetical protein AAFY45_01640 [Bacteroidota bacterium]